MHYYLVSPFSRGDVVLAAFTRIRCALTALHRRPSLRLVASTTALGVGQVVSDWLALERCAPNSVDARTNLVDELPNTFDSKWWSEYVS